MKLCVMMLPLVVVGCISDQSAHPRVKPPPPRAWIMSPPDWQTSLNRIISSLRERLITMQKQL
ncbi:Rz1 family lipoprotein [Salmonella enterica subsp. enterica serovar Kentucky]|nr:Rz1 family lipoprotein [Salmonella enterica subsp. enterica serovar Kentucky]